MMKDRKKIKEMKDFEILYRDIENKSIRGRIKSTGEWYIEKATHYKRIFYVLSMMAIVLPLVISAINVLGEDYGACIRVITTIGSTMVAMATGILTFTKCREKWTLYRSSIEKMKKELSLYSVGEKDDEALHKMVCRLEEMMEDERNKWREIQQENEQNGNTKI